MAVAYELVARFDGHNRIFGAKNEPLAMARVKSIGQLASEIS
jgi:hypothetical protein